MEPSVMLSAVPIPRERDDLLLKEFTVKTSKESGFTVTE